MCGVCPGRVQGQCTIEPENISLSPAIDAAGAYAGRDILLERLVEGAALAPVEGEHPPILLHPAERGGDHVRRYTRRPRIRRNPRNEAVEIAAAAGGVGGGSEEERGEEDGEAEGEHCGPIPKRCLRFLASKKTGSGEIT